MTKLDRRELLAAAPALLAVPEAFAATIPPLTTRLLHAPAPVDNPLKGLVPYAWQGRHFPFSMEFNYVTMASLSVGDGHYDWSELDTLIAAIAGRGNHSIFRVVLEYPGRLDCIPEWLRRLGLRTVVWDTDGTAATRSETPDYADPGLQRAVLQLIAAMGARYDGDPRLGCVTAGFLGSWGEWHTYPRMELFAGKPFQAAVMDAYQAAFQRVPVLVRYPAGPDDWTYADNSLRPLGYHDDSFAYSTIETGGPGDPWSFMGLMRRAGRRAIDKWRTRPVGGEIRPEIWGGVFDPSPPPDAQDFAACVEQTHVTWLMDSGMFDTAQSAERVARAEAMVRRMGYEYHVAAAGVGAPEAGRLPVAAQVENRGVAPFYARWRVEFGLVRGGAVVARATSGQMLNRLLPGRAQTIGGAIPLARAGSGPCAVAMRVVNPMPGGKPFCFANREQDRDLAGWLTLDRVELP